MEKWTKDALDECCAQKYIARQPILDSKGENFAFELLFRSGPSGGFSGEDEQATRTMLDNLVVYGLEKLTDGKSAFVNCTLEALTDGLVDVLAPRTTVLEVLERIEPTPALAKTCERLKSMGYRIALDDFQWVEGIEPLVALADYIKVDFLQSDAAERSALLERLRGSRAVLLAEKVETREEFEQASREGFTLFQGYFFCRPDVMTKRDIPANAMAQMELLRELQQKDLDFRAVSRVVERDPAITYRLFRTVNAAGTGVRGELFSVEKALMALGEDRFRRMVTLAVAAALSSGGSKEALRLALSRARFCELGAALTGREGTEQYLLGLFSLLPAMLQISMEEAVETIGPRAEIREALMGKCNHDSRLLRWVEFYMRGEWLICDRIASELRLNSSRLRQCALEAMNWADTMLHSME